MANDLDFSYDQEEQQIMEEMSAMSEMEREQMLDDLWAGARCCSPWKSAPPIISRKLSPR
jgi:hypothetical protein